MTKPKTSQNSFDLEHILSSILTNEIDVRLLFWLFADKNLPDNYLKLNYKNLQYKLKESHNIGDLFYEENGSLILEEKRYAERVCQKISEFTNTKQQRNYPLYGSGKLNMQKLQKDSLYKRLFEI